MDTIRTLLEEKYKTSLINIDEHELWLCDILTDVFIKIKKNYLIVSKTTYTNNKDKLIPKFEHSVCVNVQQVLNFINDITLN